MKKVSLMHRQKGRMDPMEGEITKVIKTCSEGVHAFLFVYNATNVRFTKEYQESMDHIEVSVNE